MRFHVLFHMCMFTCCDIIYIDVLLLVWLVYGDGCKCMLIEPSCKIMICMWIVLVLCVFVTQEWKMWWNDDDVWNVCDLWPQTCVVSEMRHGWLYRCGYQHVGVDMMCFMRVKSLLKWGGFVCVGCAGKKALSFEKIDGATTPTFWIDRAPLQRVSTATPPLWDYNAIL